MMHFEIITSEGQWVAFVFDRKSEDKEWWGRGPSLIELFDQIVLDCDPTTPFTVTVYPNTKRRGV